MIPTTPDNPAHHAHHPHHAPDTAVSDHKGLAALKSMSTTAGVGLGEYRAVNPLAVTSVVLAIAGLGAAIHTIFLALSVLAIGFGLFALWQIKGSSGTQAGGLLAALGVVGGLALLLLFGMGLMATFREDRAYRAEVQQRAEAFGERLAAGDYAGAYEMTGEAYRKRVPADRFAADLAKFPRYMRGQEPVYGDFTGVSTNDLTQITRDPADGTPYATAELIVDFEKADPGRYQVQLIRADGQWYFISFGDWRIGE